MYGQLDFDVVHFTRGADRARLYTATVLVQVAHKGDQATFKVEGCFTVATFVAESDGHATIEVGHFAEALGENVKAVVTGLHDGQVGKERGDGTCTLN